ncbi:DoxX family protein [Paenibacillus aceris]|uniref:Membrane protein YphA (DoxX/SURF4 family) n=1 Tax=Paenibacillus aceris TaxID=869555 RepID=A0ABS4HWN2_9BACL|nr:DoxX family protein [Paenibacillus aceris]MBP1962963.1 putative membrane protein YphA (DoxX/SURF4 family) [Paenibacillus aceris]NHW38389.1 DoxX family protein [Paenibacillus aceris]
MKKTLVLYWIFTGLLAVLMVMGSIPDILSVQSAVDLFDHLGYPAYLLPFLGIAKLLGVLAIVTPGFPRLKEWAYAGFVFDLAGAIYSSIAVGDPVSNWMTFPIGFILIAGSYIYANKKTKLAISTDRGIGLT